MEGFSVTYRQFDLPQAKDVDDGTFLIWLRPSKRLPK
jgi:hypothetical protein